MKSIKTNTRLMTAALLAACAVLLGVACGDDDDGGATANPSDTPSASETAQVTAPAPSPGTGPNPLQAMGTYLIANGVDGIALDTQILLTCTLDDIPGGVEAVSSIANIGQFCFTLRAFIFETSAIGFLFIPGEDQAWDVDLTFEEPTWTVGDIRAVSL